MKTRELSDPERIESRREYVIHAPKTRPVIQG